MENREEQETQEQGSEYSGRIRHDDDFGLRAARVDPALVKRRSSVSNKTPVLVIALSSLALLVIVFAFVMEARANREAAAYESTLPLHVSEVQAEIYRLDWIEQALLPINVYSRPGIKIEEINGVVIHNIGNAGTTAMQNRNYFANLAETQERYASSNFIICLDGEILQCVPINEMAYASNERNADTISIEVCHPDETGKFTDASYAAAVRLTAWLCRKFALTAEDVIRHYDVHGFECPRYFVRNEDAWEVFKADVAEEMTK
jgi:hypothetical protein